MPLDLTRLTQQKLPIEAVPVPEWVDLVGVREVHVGCLTSAERGAFEHGTPDDSEASSKSIIARFVAWCLREPDGRRMYEEPELAAQHLAACDSRVMRRLFRRCQAVNGEGAEAVEVAEKN